MKNKGGPNYTLLVWGAFDGVGCKMRLPTIAIKRFRRRAIKPM